MTDRVRAVPAHLTALAQHAVARDPPLHAMRWSAASSARWHDTATRTPHRLGLSSLFEETELLVARLGELDRWAADVGHAIEAADADGSSRFGVASAPASEVRVGPIRPVHPRDTTIGAVVSPAARLTFDHLPPDERDARLRAVIADHLRRLPPLGPEHDQEARQERALLQQLADGELTRTADGHRVRLLAFRGATDGDSALQVAVGELDTDDAVLVWVPGTAHGVDDLELELTYADRLRHEATTRAERDLTVIVDLYDGPDTITPEAAQERWGQRHAPDLRAVTAEAAGRSAGPVTVVGHSYGTFAIGAAADDDVPLVADAAVLLAPPGASVRHASQLNLAEGAQVWAARAPEDPIWIAADADRILGLPDVGRIGLGPDPIDPEFGADVFTVNRPDLPPDAWIRGHSQEGYLRADSGSLYNVVAVAVGRRPSVPSETDLHIRHEALGWRAWGPDQWYLGSDGSRATTGDGDAGGRS